MPFSEGQDRLPSRSWISSPARRRVTRDGRPVYRHADSRATLLGLNFPGDFFAVVALEHLKPRTCKPRKARRSSSRGPSPALDVFGPDDPPTHRRRQRSSPRPDQRSGDPLASVGSSPLGGRAREGGPESRGPRVKPTATRTLTADLLAKTSVGRWVDLDQSRLTMCAWCSDGRTRAPLNATPRPGVGSES